MRKNIIDSVSEQPELRPEQEWLDLEEMAKVEVTSEVPGFPLESALISGEKPGWRAAQKGKQIIRIRFDQPRRLRRIRLEFIETKIARTQEFALRWSATPGGPLGEIVRQQWNFSPQGSTCEIEDYNVNLDDVSVLELTIEPDISVASAFASLARWRMM